MVRHVLFEIHVEIFRWGKGPPTAPVLRHGKTHAQSEGNMKLQSPAPVVFVGYVARSLSESTGMCCQWNQEEILLDWCPASYEVHMHP